jgi:integrase
VKYELLTPKTKTSKRKIEISPIIFEELEKHQARQKEIKMQYRKTYHDKGFVFANTEEHPGYPLYIKFLESRMRGLLRISEIKDNLTPHSLRHTHTSLLAEAGVGLQEIMERLGHKDDETTKSVYLHVTKSMKKEASHKFEQLMKNL